MRNLASLAALAFFLLGLAGTAQAGGAASGVTCHAILECKTDKSGDIVVVAFTDGENGRVAADIEKGDDCTQALESLLDPGDGQQTSFFIRNISTGSTDRTVYTMAASFNATSCEPPKIVFRTDEEFLAHLLGGLSGADEKCNTAAANATPPLPGTYTAWLSDSSNDAKDRVTQAVVPYFLPDGAGGMAEKVADDFADILTCDLNCLDFSIRRNENGVVQTNQEAWTGTFATGLRAGAFCGNWTTDNDDKPRVGDVNSISSTWTVSNSRPCTQSNVGLYCFQD